MTKIGFLSPLVFNSLLFQLCIMKLFFFYFSNQSCITFLSSTTAISRTLISISSKTKISTVLEKPGYAPYFYYFFILSVCLKDKKLPICQFTCTLCLCTLLLTTHSQTICWYQSLVTVTVIDAYVVCFRWHIP